MLTVTALFAVPLLALSPSFAAPSLFAALRLNLTLISVAQPASVAYLLLLTGLDHPKSLIDYGVLQSSMFYTHRCHRLALRHQAAAWPREAAELVRLSADLVADF